MTAKRATQRQIQTQLRIPGEGEKDSGVNVKTIPGWRWTGFPGWRWTVIPTGRRTVFARARNGFHDARNVFHRCSSAGHL